MVIVDPELLRSAANMLEELAACAIGDAQEISSMLLAVRDSADGKLVLFHEHKWQWLDPTTMVCVCGKRRAAYSDGVQ